ncbi:MAG: ATP-dependent DNA helicase RecG [Oscillospiraceae bacterium]|nr:ATP-dependent DNA helicase RecG [Oscillospiraceae bacterium]
MTDPISELKGIGQARAKAFARLGLLSSYDLLRYYPAGYQDRTAASPISALVSGTAVCVTAMAAADPRETRLRQGMTLTKTHAVDETGRLELTFFNAPYVKTALVKGETYVFFGKPERKGARCEMVNPVFEPAGSAGRVTGLLLPVYRLTSGLPQYAVRAAVRQAVDALAGAEPDLLPPEIRQARALCHIGFALRQIHAPDDARSLDMARRRLAFEELFRLSLGLSWMKRGRAAKPGRALGRLPRDEFEAALPYELTGAQRRVIAELEDDMNSGRLMSRLIQGDVGSGKTIVAAAAVLMAARGGFQAALMAPTELLAAQHHATLEPFMRRWGVSCGLLTGKLSPKAKDALRFALAGGGLRFVVGTHALLSEGVSFENLGLIITDEQHRFGVAQRSALAEKGEHSPHTLFMSATPIPRTLAMLLYGELDVSLIDELPPGRVPVKTYAVGEDMRARIDGFIKKTAEQGGQVYVVCPMIERVDDEGNSVSEGLKEAVAVRERIAGLFPGHEVGLAHGRMKAKERADVIGRFRAGEIPVLVATTVIEVGVDVPNAGLMVVENADRFGLAQLHQLRGRVGRGRRESFCVLMAAPGAGELARKRLEMLTKSSDGFAIAEADLALRGPGEFFGTRQHGLPALRMAELPAASESPAALLYEARDAALGLLDADPELKGHAALRASIEDMLRGMRS